MFSTINMKNAQNDLDSIQNRLISLGRFIIPEKNDNEEQSTERLSEFTSKNFHEYVQTINESNKNNLNEDPKVEMNMKESLIPEFIVAINAIDTLNSTFQNYYTDINDDSEPINNNSERSENSLRLCFQNTIDHPYEIDADLIRQYPGSYLNKLYINPSMWMDNGDIYIDYNEKNFEYIYKYMRNDNSLIEDLKNMDSAQRNQFITDLDFMSLPVKVEYMNELFFHDDEQKIEAWKNNKVIMVNGKNSVSLNIWLKEHDLFDTVFNKHTIENIKYFKKSNIIYVNMELIFGDFIEDYCKNGIINKQLIKKENIEENYEFFENEIKKIGIQFNRKEKEEILQCFYKPMFINHSSIIKTKQYDKILQEWFGYSYDWKLIYKASEHDYSAKSFHKYCNNKGPTLTLIKNIDGSIVGGFTSVSWNDYECKNDPNAFIFTLQNPHNIPPTKYNKRKESKYAIRCDYHYGPCFYGDNGYDIFIDDNCNTLATSYIENNGTNGYECDNTYKCSLFTNTNDIMNKNYFSVFDYEVFTIDNYNDYLKNAYKCSDLIIDYMKTQQLNISLIPQNISEHDLLIELNSCEINLNNESQEKLFNYYYKPSNVFKKSHIVSNKDDQYIHQWINKKYVWKLAFRASEQEYLNEFNYQLRNNIEPSIVIIKSAEGDIFVGYKIRSCNMTRLLSKISTDFVFTLNNTHIITSTKNNKLLTTNNDPNTMTNNNCVFGNSDGADIHFYKQCNKLYRFCIKNNGKCSFECDSQYKSSLFVNTGSSNDYNNFSVLDFEVYTLVNYYEYLKDTYQSSKLLIDYIQTGHINVELIPENMKEKYLHKEFNDSKIKLNSLNEYELMKHYYQSSTIFTESHILFNEYDTYLNELLNHSNKWKLLYRASEHKFNGKSFHEYCDDQGPTLIFGKTKTGLLFGAYATQSWKFTQSNSNKKEEYENKTDSEAFIFSLKNRQNIPPMKYIKNKDCQYAIRCTPNNGPAFGNDQGIDDEEADTWCHDMFDSPLHYLGPNCLECMPQHDSCLFIDLNQYGNQYDFDILDYEVYCSDH